MASLTQRLNNPWALKTDKGLDWAKNTYEGVVGLDPNNFIIYEDPDSGRKAMDQEYRVEKAKGITIGEHLRTHVGATADSAGYEDALRNVPAMLSEATNQTVTLDTPLADIDPVLYKQVIARQEGMGKDGMKIFFPETDTTGVDANSVTPNFLQTDRNYGQGSKDRERAMFPKLNTAYSDTLLPELLEESETARGQSNLSPANISGQPNLQTQPVNTRGTLETEYSVEPFVRSREKPDYRILPDGTEMYNWWGNEDSIRNEEGELINDPYQARLKRMTEERSPSKGNLKARPIGLDAPLTIDDEQSTSLLGRLQRIDKLKNQIKNRKTTDSIKEDSYRDNLNVNIPASVRNSMDLQNAGYSMFERFPEMSVEPTPTRPLVPVGEGPVSDDSIPMPDNTGLDLNLDEFAPSAKVSRPTTARTPSPATTERNNISNTRLLPTILQALGAAGQSYLQNRAIKEANESTRENQARSNLINALARGSRAGVVKETPSTGLGTALFQSLSELGAGQERARSKALEEQQRQSQIDINRERLRQQEVSGRQSEEDRAYRRERDRRSDAEKLEEKLYRRERDAAADQRLLDEEERAIKEADLNAMQGEGASLANLFEQIGASGDVVSFDELIQSEPQFAKIFNSLDRENQTAVMSKFQKGLNASVKTTESAEAKRVKEEQKIARDALLNTASTAGESGGYANLDELFRSQPSFKKIFDEMSEVEQVAVKLSFEQGKIAAGEDAAPEHSELVNNVAVVKANWDAMTEGEKSGLIGRFLIENTDVDAQGKPIDQSWVTRTFFEKEYTYTQVRNALALSIASAFNRGRPTDKDYEITLRLFPKLNETKYTADAKWQAIAQLLSLKKQAQDQGWRQDPNKDFLSTGIIDVSDSDKPRIDFEAARRYFNATGRTAPVVDTTTGKTRTQNSGGLTLDLGAKE